MGSNTRHLHDLEVARQRESTVGSAHHEGVELVAFGIAEIGGVEVFAFAVIGKGDAETRATARTAPGDQPIHGPEASHTQFAANLVVEFAGFLEIVGTNRNVSDHDFLLAFFGSAEVLQPKVTSASQP